MVGLLAGFGNGFSKFRTEVIVLRKILAMVGLAIVQVSVFFFEEAWTVTMVSLFNFAIAVFLTTCLFTFFSVITSWLCENTGLDKKIDDWIEKKKEKMIATSEKAITVGFWIICLQTAIVVSPSATAIVMYLLGEKKMKVYWLDLFFSFITAIIWCLIYGGSVIIIKKFFGF